MSEEEVQVSHLVFVDIWHRKFSSRPLVRHGHSSFSLDPYDAFFCLRGTGMLRTTLVSPGYRCASQQCWTCLLPRLVQLVCVWLEGAIMSTKACVLLGCHFLIVWLKTAGFCLAFCLSAPIIVPGLWLLEFRVWDLRGKAATQGTPSQSALCLEVPSQCFFRVLHVYAINFQVVSLPRKRNRK